MRTQYFLQAGAVLLALAIFWLLMDKILGVFDGLSAGGNIWKQGAEYMESERVNNEQMQSFRDRWAKARPVAVIFVVVGCGFLIAGLAGA